MVIQLKTLDAERSRRPWETSEKKAGTLKVPAPLLVKRRS